MENKNIKDYLRFYLGCEVLTDNGIETLVGVGLLGSDAQRFRTIERFRSSTNDWSKENKIILRPLSDMSEDEALEVAENILSLNGLNLDDWSAKDIVSAYVEQWDRYTPEETKWLLSKGFDLFGLIESGLAIDKTKLTDHGN
jgi:hypothetical protein